MRKRGEYQKRKERQQKISEILSSLMFLVLTVILLYGLIQSAVNVYDIDHHSLNTYTGPYQYELRVGHGRHHRYNYYFTLDNGDNLVIGRRWIENEDMLANCEELTFQYTTMYANPLYGTYSPASITTVDGKTVVMDIDKSRSESVGYIWIWSVLLVLWLGLLFGYLVMSYYVGDWKKRYLKWRKIRTKKAKQTEIQK